MLLNVLVISSCRERRLILLFMYSSCNMCWVYIIWRGGRSGEFCEVKQKANIHKTCQASFGNITLALWCRKHPAMPNRKIPHTGAETALSYHYWTFYMWSAYFIKVWSPAAYCERFQRSNLQPRTCLDHLCEGRIYSGGYDVNPTGFSGFSVYVYCDQTTDGGGWTVNCYAVALNIIELQI